MKLRFGRTRVFWPMSLKLPHTWFFPIGYEELDAEALIEQAIETGAPRLCEVEDMLDQRENQKR